MNNEKKNSKEKDRKSEVSGQSFSISSDRDIVTIRKFGRHLAGKLGFERNDQTLIATALSEVCRNVIEYAGKGEVTIESGRREKSNSISITVSDNGPGISDVNKALQEGYSTGRGMGVGLPGSKRIMDEFEIESEIGRGTTIKMCKWVNRYGY